METLFILSILGWSITNILVNGSILDPLRIYLQVMNPVISKLLTCMQCSGFWVGILLGSFVSAEQIYNPFAELIIEGSLLGETLLIAFFGFWTSGVSVLINSLLIYLINSSQRKINTNGEL
jgi:hypothetical protein